MYKMKRVLSCSAVAAILLSMTACNDSGNADEASVTFATTGVTINTSEFNDENKSKINDAAEEKISGELENKTIKWMANWDINPDSTGKSKSAELTMFEEKFSGKVEYYPVTFETQYDELAAAILGGEGIDFTYRGAYINGAANGMFQPVDDYVDFNSDLWKDNKAINDQFVINGSHYALITAVTGGEVVIYNKKTIENYGLDDPAELLANGEWNWDTYKNMLAEFVNVDEGRYGIDGWWIEGPLYLTTGKSLISLDNGKVTSNIRTPEIERAMNYIYDLSRNSYLIDKSLFGWTTNESFIGTGDELFFPCGLWTLWKDKSLWSEVFGEDVMFVPMPKDPSADEYYLPADLEGFMLCKGAQNPDGVIKYAECCLVAAQDESINAMNRQKFIDDYGWREDMVDMMDTVNEMTRENPVLELYSDSTNDIKSLLDSAKSAASNGTEWNVTLNTYADTIDVLVSEINEKME